jgi:pimeloyl-ACP methyl ester carboxylesterase
MIIKNPMRRSFSRAFVCVLSASALVLAAQTPPAVNSYMPKPTGLSEADLSALRSDMAKLAAQVADLKKQFPSGPMRDRVADVEVYWWALHNQIDRNLRTDLARAQHAVQSGFERAAQLARGETPWMSQHGVRGFSSKIDGSVQPYILNLPVGFDAAARRAYRLDIFLHGRENGGFELNFFGKSTTSFNNMPLNPAPDRFILQPYGRYSNANRFAGETDVMEAIDSVNRAYAIDPNRVVLTGFSMGGASAWHLAVHHADKWAASSAGAGFAETAQYLKYTPETMPPSYETTLWHLYDATDYAVNTFNSPTVAYSGEIDPQKQSADVMEAAIRAEGLTLERMIGPQTGHSYEPATRLALIARLDELAAKGRNPAPTEVRFTTWTLRYNKMHWIEIDGLEEHWKRARVDAKVAGDLITVKTVNVSGFHLRWPAGLAPFRPGVRPMLDVNGRRIRLPAVAADGSLEAAIGSAPAGALRKVHGLQGPIDDAFLESFMIVRPTGRPMSDALGKWAQEQLAFATSEWQEVFRGDPRIKNDTDITAADLAEHHLVLFGDPSSNAVYKRIAGKLPIAWTTGGVSAGPQKFSADAHAPVLIYPNPLNPKKYVVINSGFTFHDPSSNSRQSPKLPDWAIVNITEPGTRALPVSVKAQGFFDERWRLR